MKMNTQAILADIAITEAKLTAATDKHDINFFQRCLINLRAELAQQ